jgi:hypothetical protein
MDIAIIISIIGVVISLTIGVWNIKINLENTKLKKIEVDRELKNDQKKRFDIRPKFELLSSSDLIEYDANKNEFDIDCLVVPIKNHDENGARIRFTYDDKFKNKEDWMSIEYVLKNAGSSTIDYFYIAWNLPKTTSLFDVNRNEYMFYFEQKLLNYRVLCEKNIKKEQVIKIRINFHKDCIIYKNFSAEADFWMIDEYKQYWSQPFFVHKKIIYDSCLVSHDDFKNYTDTKDAINCFRNPWLW